MDGGVRWSRAFPSSPLASRISTAQSRFYEAMGLKRHEITDGVAFFQMGGVDPGAVAPRRTCQGCRRRKTANQASPAWLLAYNTRSDDEVDEVLATAEQAGGRIVKPAQRAFWGGWYGYFADTEGNLWEVAHNPAFPIDAEGNISLPA